MSELRILPLFDEKAQPQAWNERMAPGEYPVHFSNFNGAAGGRPGCVVFGSVADAEAYAKAEVERDRSVRCRIYDHRGFVGAPIAEFRGSEHKGESEMSSRVRRWLGGGLVAGGVLLTAVDWRSDFKLAWPAMIGTRIILPGLLLLVIEVVIAISARRKRAQGEGTSAG